MMIYESFVVLSSQFFNDESLKFKILDKYPVPDAGKTMDSFISPLLEMNNKQIDQGADLGAQNIQSRVMKVIGPFLIGSADHRLRF